MKSLINYDDVNTKIITIRNQNVILDSDVAVLYGVQTKEVNQAIKNNPKKFPEGYVFELSKQEWYNQRALTTSTGSKSAHSGHVVKNFDHIAENSRKSDGYLKSHAVPKAFTEKGLYMLATILKSNRAIEATIAIVETFAKLKELANNIATLNSIDPEVIEPEVIESTVKRAGGLLNDLFFSALPTSSETSVELNLGLLKAKHSVKSEVPVYQSEFDNLKRMIEKKNERLEKIT